MGIILNQFQGMVRKFRTGKEQMRKSGESDPRNKGLMKMFNLIYIGERAGSGVADIFNTWEQEGWVEPIIGERYYL